MGECWVASSEGQEGVAFCGLVVQYLPCFRLSLRAPLMLHLWKGEVLSGELHLWNMQLTCNC